MDDHKKIGYALGGGGARGLAHIGVLKVLHDSGYFPDIIVGTSIGAMVGALYAGGHSPAEIEELVLGLNWKKLVALADVTIPISGLFHGNRVVSLLRSIIGDLKFQQLKCAFACVATDIVSGEQIVLREGSLVDAIRASISLPGIFTPVLISGRYLVDGGLVNTVPVSVCREMGADFVIGVNVIPDPNKISCSPNKQTQYPTCEPPQSQREQEKALPHQGRSMKSHINNVDNATRKFLSSYRPKVSSNRSKSLFSRKSGKTSPLRTKSPRLIDVLSQALNITEYRIAAENLKDADIAISPNLEEVGFWQFNNASQAIKAGETATQEALTANKAAALKEYAGVDI